MAFLLPTVKQPPTRKSPKILIIYSAPKIGKTTLLSQLEDCLIADVEDGAAYLEALKVKIDSVAQFNAFCEELRAKITVDKKFPYRYGALDTASKFEEWMEAEATSDYKMSVIGKNFNGSSVLQLPEGAGYLWLRNCFQRHLHKFMTLFPRVILTGHLKEKLISSGNRAEDAKVTDKEKAVKMDISVTATDIDLTGKIRNICCAGADAICYLFRTPEGKMMASFKNIGSVAGSRCDHLKNTQFEFDWKKIYID